MLEEWRNVIKQLQLAMTHNWSKKDPQQNSHIQSYRNQLVDPYTWTENVNLACLADC